MARGFLGLPRVSPFYCGNSNDGWTRLIRKQPLSVQSLYLIDKVISLARYVRIMEFEIEEPAI